MQVFAESEDHVILRKLFLI